jgi:hypothetical protein
MGDIARDDPPQLHIESQKDRSSDRKGQGKLPDGFGSRQSG